MKRTSGLRNIWYNLSSNQRYFIRRLYYFPKDLMDKLSGKSHKYVPPRGFIYTGSPASAEKYVQQGRHQVQLLKDFVQLQQNDTVLDIGSGIGRTAIGLTEFLSGSARYEGFDVVRKGVDWCSQKIAKDFPHFHFTYVPLFNDLYNESKKQATDFVFPYEKDTFDKAFSFSVFTHMKISEIEHYFTEINRVTKPGGLSLHTFFLYEDADAQYISTRQNFRFPVDKGNYKLMSEKVESANIAIHKAELKAMAERSGLEILNIVDGFWKDEVKSPSKIEYQDMVVFRKP